MTDWQISPDVIAEHNRGAEQGACRRLRRAGRAARAPRCRHRRVTKKVAAFHVAVPSWASARGTRFARSPASASRANPRELDDCLCHPSALARHAAGFAPIPWDKPHAPAELKQYAAARGLASMR